MSEPVEPPHGVLTPPELAAEGLKALKEAFPSVSKRFSWHHIALLTKPYRERVEELESPWKTPPEIPKPFLGVLVELDDGEAQYEIDFIDSKGKWYMSDAEGYDFNLTRWMYIPE